MREGAGVSDEANQSHGEDETHGEELLRSEARRAALKAALAGATAATVWSAPRVVGMSMVPDYASAATCNDSSSTIQLATRDCGGALVGGCWGSKNNNSELSQCNCGSLAYNSTLFGSITVSGNRTGGFNGDDGKLNISLNGMNATNTFDKCTVNVGVSNVSYSGVGDWTFSNSTHTFNTNGSVNNIDIDFDGDFGVYVNSVGNLDLSVTCECAHKP